MKWLLSFCIIYILLPTSIVFASTGDLQISCPPGVQIFLNSRYIGTTGEMKDGLFIGDLKPGLYTLRASKSGYKDKKLKIKISKNETAQYRIEFPKGKGSVMNSGSVGRCTVSGDLNRNRDRVDFLNIAGVSFSAWKDFNQVVVNVNNNEVFRGTLNGWKVEYYPDRKYLTTVNGKKVEIWEAGANSSAEDGITGQFIYGYIEGVTEEECNRAVTTSDKPKFSIN
jgi:hypothetical protein